MWTFFTDGIKHITDLEGYDHMLFLIALAAPFKGNQWKELILLATAFTLGHSISLALAASDTIHFSSELIELLIPVTILITCISNFFILKSIPAKISGLRYFVTLCFGLIHGLGFSSYFKMIFDEASTRFVALIAFNLGVEAGQLIILTMFLGIVWITTLLNFNHQRFVYVLSIFCGVIASYLIMIKVLG